jgi:DNA-binding response OmpR family regulator
MLSANTDEQSRSQGFLVGTDDYMGKPVSIPELHTRVTRLLRRTYGL